MRTTRTIVVAIVLLASGVGAQDVQTQADSAAAGRQPLRVQSRRAPAVQPEQKASVRPQGALKKHPVPSIIQSELDRSRAEEKQHAAVRAEPVRQDVPAEPVWPLFVAVGAGIAAAAGVVLYFHRRKNRSGAPAKRQETPAVQAEVQTAVAQPPAVQQAREFLRDDAHETAEDDTVTSTSPYVNDDDLEMPEAALTMNLLNKKRETKKELILEVMKRVQRKENPQHIAEALRIGIGEVHLAMTLAKLKK